MLKPKENYEEYTRKVYEKAREMLEMSKDMEIGKGIKSISFDLEGNYIYVSIPSDHGTYRMTTFGEEKPRLSFEEK